MLRTTTLLNNTSVERLSQLWAERYLPDLSNLSKQIARLPFSELLEAASPEGRAKTVAKLQRMVEINCKCAAIQTNVIFSYIPNVVSLTEGQGIARTASQVYQKVLEVYQKHSPSSALLSIKSKEDGINISIDALRSSTMPRLSVEDVKQLAATIEPVLLQLQEQYLLAPDRRTIGFMSTQFHLTSKLVLARLTLPEQLLLSPYFKFVEEQVCIPWQRVCAAAAKHNLDSPMLALVQHLLPASREIAQRVYSRAAQLYPNHRSRRGELREPKVRTSSIRDIEMFQGYLWLCTLEGNMTAAEQELLPLCIMVFPSIDVSWELVEQLLPLLIAEIHSRLKPEQIQVLLPYTQAMQKLFSNLEATASKKLDVIPCYR
ncbi:MAG TPA: hypothetical protein DCE56_07020 [Cyanobacteria bacterium UBA8553]|nr:hypothetical protein [Cyanobacteria bacterium UBA8553]HAJ58831.1 hypothetical protein [Cyanobacteria bacterium UBA8543]